MLTENNAGDELTRTPTVTGWQKHLVGDAEFCWNLTTCKKIGTFQICNGLSMYDNFRMYTQRFSTLRLIEIGPLLSRKVIYSAGDSSNERKKEQSLLCEESRTVENGVRNRENKPIISMVI